MQNQKFHNYIFRFVKKINKKYQKNIIVFYDEKCNREYVQYFEDRNVFVFTYGNNLIQQAKNMEKKWRYLIRYTTLHEIGHMVRLGHGKYETFKDKIESEYQAERFALNCLKELFPATYRWACKEGYAIVHNPKWATCKSEKHYRCAFERIKEYVE